MKLPTIPNFILARVEESNSFYELLDPKNVQVVGVALREDSADALLAMFQCYKGADLKLGERYAIYRLADVFIVAEKSEEGENRG